MTPTQFLTSFVSILLFLIAQLILWVWWAATMHERLRSIKEAVEKDLREQREALTRHVVIDEGHHKAVWSRVDRHTLILAKLGYINGNEFREEPGGH